MDSQPNHGHEEESGTGMPEGPMENIFALKMHAILMLGAWWLLFPMAMMTARYYRHELSVTFSKKATWFLCHRTCALLGVGCVATGLLCILIHTEGRWVDEIGPAYTHAAFGMLAIVGVFLQPIIAIFRCSPSHRSRPIFTWFHRVFGFSIWIAAQIAIMLVTFIPYLGMTIDGPQGASPRLVVAMYWITSIVAIVCFEIFSRFISSHKSLFYLESDSRILVAEQAAAAEKFAKTTFAKTVLWNIFVGIAVLLFTAFSFYAVDAINQSV